MRARRVDAVDKGIIEALQRNGREPFRRIAARLGCATTDEAVAVARGLGVVDAPVARVERVTRRRTRAARA